MELWPNAGTTSGRGTELARAAGIGARKHAGAAPTRPPGAARVHRSAAAWRCATGPQQSPVVRAAAAPWCCGGPWAAERTRRRRGVPPVPPERTRRARGRAVAAYGVQTGRRAPAARTRCRPAAPQPRREAWAPYAPAKRNAYRLSAQARPGQWWRLRGVVRKRAEQQPRHAPDAALRAAASACRGERVGVTWCGRPAEKGARPARCPCAWDACSATPVFYGPMSGAAACAPPCRAACQPHNMSHRCADARQRANAAVPRESRRPRCRRLDLSTERES